MKIYLAAPYAARDILKEHVPLFEYHGHEITCGWLKGTRPLGESSYGISEVSTQEEVEAHAQMDLEDVEQADVVVLYTAGYVAEIGGLDPVAHNLTSGGRHVEVGYALAKGKPVIVIGPLENIFQRGLCLWAQNLDDVVVYLTFERKGSVK